MNLTRSYRDGRQMFEYSLSSLASLVHRGYWVGIQPGFNYSSRKWVTLFYRSVDN